MSKAGGLPIVPELTGEYLLLRELGRGGSAVVYLARDRELEREVAIKLIRPPLVGDDESRARFNREARTAALLNHPNIVGVHAVKRLSDGGLALVMHYVPGRTLKQILRQTGPLEFEHVERVLFDIAGALAYAHERGVVHRDVKPENIFIHEGEGRALLADFGIARTAESHNGITLDGVAIGTPAYMAPEHVDGSLVDCRADLYSLGMVGWEMVTGEAPWEGESLYSIVYKQKHAELAPLGDFRSDVPFHLWYVIERLTRKERERRFPDAGSLVDALQDARTATPWRQWWMKRGLRRPATREASPPPLAVPESLVQPIGAELSASKPREPVTDGETVRYRRTAPLLDTDDPPPAQETPRSAVSSHDEPDVDPDVESSAVQPAVQVESTWAQSDSADPEGPEDPLASVLVTVGSQEDEPRLVLRRAPLVTASIAMVLLTGVGAALFAVGGVEQPSMAEVDQDSDVRLESAAVASMAWDPPAFPFAPHLHAADPDPVIDGDTDRGDGPDPSGVAMDAEEPEAEDAEPPATELSEPAVTERPPRVARFPSRPLVSAGGFHTCSVVTDGSVYCWGGNSGGQVGNGQSGRSPSPVRLSVQEPMREIAAGFSHTCGITATGGLMCWGANESGQLGVGSLSSSRTPAAVSDQRTFETVTTGRSHSCALTSDGEAFCWGANSSGQLGDRTRTARSAPARVASESGFMAISAGWNHTCALTVRGTALCWGQNAEGQLGNDATADHTLPTAVVGRRAYTRIASGGAHTCALASNGAAFCWGRNAHGQLGDGSTIGHRVPVSVNANVGFVEITAGGVHTCALTREGEAFCWGRNIYGQLGDGSNVDRLAPTRVETDERFVSLHASGSHTCGITRGGERHCWGYNLDGQLGDGSRSHQPRPVRIPSLQG